jgi:hypothetical protein
VPAEEARAQLAQIAVTLRAFATAAGAVAVTLVLDQGEGTAPLLIECPTDGLLELTEGEATVQLDADRLAAEPLPLPHVRALPPFEVDAVRAQITSPLGGVEHLARAVLELVEVFPGRSVLSAVFATSDPDTPLQLAARSGDPLILALGEEQFEMGDWP